VKVLGIETSCDETSAAVVADGQILSNVVSSQIELHRPYGGVVPELASRRHLELIDDVIRAALDEASMCIGEIDAIAATYGPGLASSLLIGLNAGKGIALAAGKPFIGINHLEAHLYSPALDGAGLPMVSLIVSGGHTILAHVTGIGQHAILGQTIDDAAGEAFDKVAKLLQLGYPGGPEIDRLAKTGNPRAIAFPRSMLNEPGHDFSFSGLKTSVLYFLRKNPTHSVPDVCASFQEAVVDILAGKLLNAAEEYRVQTVSLAGGVSINSRLREKLTGECATRGLRLRLAPAKLCTDNAGMIAALAHHKLLAGQHSSFSLEVAPSAGLGVAA
jgi:N6-L-threonylcarbamoyladenine synthase